MTNALQGEGTVEAVLMFILEIQNDTAAEQEKEPRICSFSLFQTESLISQTHMLMSSLLSCFSPDQDI